MNVNEFLKETISVKEYDNGRYEFQEIRPQIVCKDGVRLSVQASDGHYCHPRENGINWYTEVEVGYPSIRPPETWKEYFDGEWPKWTGIIGWLNKIWKNRSNIVYTLKHKPVSKRMLSYYAGFQDGTTDNIYAYIPVDLVDSFITNHGGIDKEETFKS